MEPVTCKFASLTFYLQVWNRFNVFTLPYSPSPLRGVCAVDFSTQLVHLRSLLRTLRSRNWVHVCQLWLVTAPNDETLRASRRRFIANILLLRFEVVPLLHKAPAHMKIKTITNKPRNLMKTQNKTERKREKITHTYAQTARGPHNFLPFSLSTHHTITMHRASSYELSTTCR